MSEIRDTLDTVRKRLNEYPHIEKLTFELINLDPVDLNYLLGLTGAKYLPSVYYKVRMIPFFSDAMMAQAHSE